VPEKGNLASMPGPSEHATRDNVVELTSITLKLMVPIIYVVRKEKRKE
jgi:hypothetical protein